MTSNRKCALPESFSAAVAQQMRDLEHARIQLRMIPTHNNKTGSLYNKLFMSCRATLHSVACHINNHLLKVATCNMLKVVCVFV